MSTYIMRVIKFLALAALLAASGCSLLPDQIDTTKDWSAERFYSEGKEALQSGDYQTAIKHFEALEARFPFGRYAQQAQLELIYAYYKDEETASAVAAADRFIKLHPRHPFVDYAYYLKGLTNFNQSRGIVERYIPQDPTQRDPGAARQSFQDFAELVKRFPDSKYSEDARQRMIYLRNNLAQYEVNVARYYMKREAYVAAANRAKYAVENYQSTPAIPDALGIMVQAYKVLGLNDLAADAMRVLELNYPEHPALAEAKAVDVN
jgi:outer membrane protein assembly factor BamD